MPDFNCVYGKYNHGECGEHGDKSVRAMTFHFLFPVLPALPVVVTVHAIANRSKRRRRKITDRRTPERKTSFIAVTMSQF
jgi:hypothetical protein